MAYFEMAREAFTNLFKKPACLMYPLETRSYPAGARGHITNTVDSCIFCGICQKKCPTNAITVDRKAKTWQLNHLQCLACGCCSEACPKQCLDLHTGYSAPLSAADKSSSYVRLTAPEVEAPSEAA